ncbi:MAG: DMT family transporter [Runella sp.]
MTQKNYWLGAAMVIFSAFCFALKGIFIKLAYQYPIDTISLLTLRMGFAAPFYVLVAFRLWYQRKVPIFSQKDWFWVVGLGVLGYYVSSYLNFLGFHYISAALERVLLFMYPTFVLIINVVLRGKKVTHLQLVALTLTYSGIFLAFSENIGAISAQNLTLGAFWVILSGLTYAFFLVGSDKILTHIGSEKFTVFAMLSATVAVFLHCLMANGFQIWHYPIQVYLIGLGMAIFSTVVPTFLLAAGIKRVGASNTSLLNSIGPIFTIFLATIVLDEFISLLQILGTFLVLLGVFLIGWKGRNH